MRFRVETTRTKVTEATDAELAWLDEFLTFEDTAKFFIRKKFGRGDVHLRMLDRRNNTFPTGMIPIIQREAKAEAADREFDLERLKKRAREAQQLSFQDLVELGDAERSTNGEFAIHLEDRRPAIPDWDDDADLEWLRDDQFDACWKIKNTGGGILHLPTGSGKTEIFCGLCHALPVHWLFVVHRKDLMHQAAERWMKRGGHEPGIVGDGQFRPDPDRRLTVTTFQTLSKGLQKDERVRRLLADVEALCVDECHTCAAQSFWKVAMATRRARVRVGLSGTPLARGDRRSVYAVAALGPTVFRIKTEKLIEDGILARPKIRAVVLPQDCDAKTWQVAYKRLVEDSGPRNAIVVAMTRLAKKPALVFVKNVNHGRFLTKMLNQAGITSEFVWGSKNTPQRQRAVQKLRDGDLEVIVCSVIFQEGVDIPELEAVVNAGAGKSTIAALQRIGRGMRSDQGRKTTFEVWDIKDEANGFMVNQSRARMRAYKKEGHSIEFLKESDVRWHQT